MHVDTTKEMTGLIPIYLDNAAYYRVESDT